MKRAIVISALMLAFAARAQDAAPWWGALASDTQASDTTDFGAWFHVDASAVSSFVLAPANGTNFVARWNDWRNNGLYAISNSASLPYVLLGNQNGRNALGILPYVSYESGLPYPQLKWSSAATSIMAIFSVWKKDQTASFTPFLGSYSVYDLHGDGNYVVFGLVHISTYIVNGTNRVNGVVTAAGDVMGGPGYRIITLLPSGPLRADNFGLDRVYRSGGQYIAETLIFTNVVDAGTVSAIEAYLATKWGITITQ